MRRPLGGYQRNLGVPYIRLAGAKHYARSRAHGGYWLIALAALSWALVIGVVALVRWAR